MLLKVDLSQDHQIFYLMACICAFFSPEILQAGAVTGFCLERKRVEQRETVSAWKGGSELVPYLSRQKGDAHVSTRSSLYYIRTFFFALQYDPHHTRRQLTSERFLRHMISERHLMEG